MEEGSGPLRVLVVSQYFWPEDFRINDLCQELVAKGHSVDVLTGLPNYPVGAYIKPYGPLGPFLDAREGIRIFRVPIPPRRTGALFLLLNYLSFLFLSLAAVPAFLFRKYDHVITVGLSPGFAVTAGVLIARLKGIPSSCWLLDLWPESLQAAGIVKSSRAIDAIRPAFTRLYGAHTHVLCQSRSFQRHLASHGIPPEKLVHFPNWAEALYQPLPRLRPRGPGDPFVILFAGNLGEAQDLGTLAEAAEELRDEGVEWHVYGDGRQKPWLEGRIREKGLEGVVRLFGRRPQEDMPRLFSEADGLYISLKDDPFMRMTLPGRIQSFMACGKPVLGAIGGEAFDLIRESGCGLVVMPSQPRALAEAVRALKSLPPEAIASMGRLARAYYLEHFDKQERMLQMIRLLRPASRP